MSKDKNIVMPLQPISDDENGVQRFVENRIVSKLLDAGPLDMNDLAIMDFSQQERIQFAQLIGYSVSGFGSLSYVDEETYGAAARMDEGSTEQDARLDELREQLSEIREGLKIAAGAAFKIHPDDLES